MFGIHDYWMFIAAGIVLILTPGQDTIYIAGRSITGGRRIGIASALGVAAGTTVHVTAATFGLSAILATSGIAFAIVKWVGAAYLVYLGIQLLLSRETFLPESGSSVVCLDAWSAFRKGVVSNVLNPKVALFFLAFLPQFVQPDSTQRSLAFLVLGATFVTMGTVWCMVIAIASARASERIRRSEKTANLVRRVAGCVFVGLGVRVALARSR